jgi:hypothetical protein
MDQLVDQLLSHPKPSAKGRAVVIAGLVVVVPAGVVVLVRYGLSRLGAKRRTPR